MYQVRMRAQHRWAGQLAHGACEWSCQYYGYSRHYWYSRYHWYYKDRNASPWGPTFAHTYRYIAAQGTTSNTTTNTQHRSKMPSQPRSACGTWAADWLRTGATSM